MSQTDPNRTALEPSIHPPGLEVSEQLTLDRVTVRLIAAQNTLQHAQEDLEAYVTARFEAVHGQELARLKRQIAEAQRAYDQAVEELDMLTKLLRDEPRDREAVPDATQEQTPWLYRDLLEAKVLLIAMAAALSASYLTTQSNWAASYLPIFIEQPWLTWVMATIPPIGSVLLKVAVMWPKSHRLREGLSLALYLASCGFLIAWVLLFSAQFNGVSGGLDLFADPAEAKGGNLIAIQLFAEMVIGAALFVRYATIHKRYAPDKDEPNAKRQSLQADLDAATDAVAARNEALGALEGQQRQLEARKTEALSAAMSTLKAQFERFGDLPL